eukprot:2121910-Prymnesium_polylepis.1
MKRLSLLLLLSGITLACCVRGTFTPTVTMPGSCSSPSFVMRAHTALYLRLESWPRCASAR